MPPSLESDIIVPNSRLDLYRYFFAVRNHRNLARKCRENGNIMDEYRSLFKATSILMQTIPKHTNYKEPRWQKLHTDLSKTLKDDVVRLEELKTLIKSGQVTVLRAIKPGAIRVEASRMPPVDWTLHIPTVAGTAHMPQHFFVNNPTVERIASQPAGTVATVGDPNDPFAASAAFSTLSLAPGVPPPPPPPAGVPFTGAAALPDWVHSMQQRTGNQTLAAKHDLFGRTSSATSPSPSAAGGMDYRPQYPAIQAPEPASLDLLGNPPQNIPLPPQEMPVTTQVVTSMPKLEPHSSCCDHPAPPSPPSHSAASADAVAQLPSATDQLRNVYLHPRFMQEFLAYAQSNTRRGIESCGVLGGEVSADSSAFTITKLILPKQKGEQNTVEVTDDVELYMYMEERALQPLGWIHTHPTQTCFLSSIDVHTQSGYQTQLAEAMAIVVAPTDPRTKQKIFRLTTPGGLGLVSRCTATGFHPHSVPESGQEIYELCGHVYLDETATFECADLR